jgi:DNA-binding beta-propeller fold protein YncE
VVSRALRRAATAIAIALLAPLSTATPESAASPVVWPAAPDKARVQFVRSFSNAEELGIAKGFFARLKDFVFGETESYVVRPMAVVADAGAIYVADPGVKGVHRYDVAGGDYSLITGPEGMPLPSPVGLARGDGGDVYVADSQLARVLVIHPGARYAAPLHLDPNPRQPTGIAFDAATKRLYVADTAAHRIDVFDGNGSRVAQIGRRGIADGEFNFPTYLWLNSAGQLYVTDSLNHRIQMFDRQGRFVAKFGRQGEGTGDAARPKGVATDRHGHIYVVDALFHAFQIFDVGGRLLLPIGQIGAELGEFWLPTGIFIDAEDTIYVTDSYNRRVQVMRYVGGPG